MTEHNYRIYRNLEGVAYWIDTYTELGRVRKTFGEHFPQLTKPSILDAGCSRGYTSIELLEIYPGARVTGIDIDEESIAQAKINSSLCRFVHGDVYNFDFNKKFDIAFFMNNLLFLPNQGNVLEGALSRAAGLIAPKGYLALSADKVWALFQRNPKFKLSAVSEYWGRFKSEATVTRILESSSL